MVNDAWNWMCIRVSERGKKSNLVGKKIRGTGVPIRQTQFRFQDFQGKLRGSDQKTVIDVFFGGPAGPLIFPSNRSIET